MEVTTLHFRTMEVFTSYLGCFQKVVIGLYLNTNYIPPCEVYSLFVFKYLFFLEKPIILSTVTSENG